jgi:hypothetical protein
VRDVGIRRVGAQREVSGADDRVCGDLGNLCVDPTPLGSKVTVENGRQQRMRETDDVAVTFDDPCGEGGLERVR